MNTHLTFTYIAYVIVSILISLTVHEFMHAFVGHKLGDDTASNAGRISFNPFDHIDPFATVILPIITVIIFGVPILAAKPVPFNPSRLKFDEFGAAMVAAAGPVSNLVLAFIGAVIAMFVGIGSPPADFLQVFVVLNVAIFVFNLIPIPPLDGSRVLYAFAPQAVRNLFDSIEPYGFVIIIALVLMGGLGGILTNLNDAVLNILPG
jgi:Zn-dependent protease